MAAQLSRLHALPTDLHRYLHLRRLQTQDPTTFYQVSHDRACPVSPLNPYPVGR
jgi:hypothetical protein